MDTQTLGGRLHQLRTRQHDGQALSVEQLSAALDEINDLSSQVHSLPPGDLQANTAQIDQLRRQYTDWYDAAVEQARTAQPVQTVPAREDEFTALRELWLAAAAPARLGIQQSIVDCLDRAEAKPEGEQVAARIRTFLTAEAGLDGW